MDGVAQGMNVDDPVEERSDVGGGDGELRSPYTGGWRAQWGQMFQGMGEGGGGGGKRGANIKGEKAEGVTLALADLGPGRGGSIVACHRH